MMMLLALPQPGPAVCIRRPCRDRLELEHRAQPETEQAGASDAEDIAPRDTQLRIAEIFPRSSGYDDHCVAPKRFGRAKYLAGRKPTRLARLVQTNIVSCRQGFVVPKKSGWGRSFGGVWMGATRRAEGSDGRQDGAGACLRAVDRAMIIALVEWDLGRAAGSAAAESDRSPFLPPFESQALPRHTRG